MFWIFYITSVIITWIVSREFIKEFDEDPWILFFLLLIPFINIIVLFSLLFQYYNEEIEQFFRKTNWKKILFFIKDGDK